VTVSTVNDSVAASAVIEIDARVTTLTWQSNGRTIRGIKNGETVAKVESQSTLPTSKSGTDFVKAIDATSQAVYRLIAFTLLCSKRTL
jgi:hypothetical protein